MNIKKTFQKIKEHEEHLGLPDIYVRIFLAATAEGALLLFLTDRMRFYAGPVRHWLGIG